MFRNIALLTHFLRQRFFFLLLYTDVTFKNDFIPIILQSSKINTLPFVIKFNNITLMICYLPSPEGTQPLFFTVHATRGHAYHPWQPLEPLNSSQMYSIFMFFPITISTLLIHSGFVLLGHNGKEIVKIFFFHRAHLRRFCLNCRGKVAREKRKRGKTFYVDCSGTINY